MAIWKPSRGYRPLFRDCLGNTVLFLVATLFLLSFLFVIFQLLRETWAIIGWNILWGLSPFILVFGLAGLCHGVRLYLWNRG